MRVRFASAAAVVAALACRDGGKGGADSAGFAGFSMRRSRPDEAPVVVNKVLPFRYPAPLYARKVQGNVTLRLFIDADGRVQAESTRVEETSGYPALDSAAVIGSQDLQFVPAKLHGEPLGVVVLFPVYFRHPEAPPLPGDTVLGKRETGGGARQTP